MSSIKPIAGSELNFSDIIDVIEHDPDYNGPTQQQNTATSPPEKQPSSSASSKSTKDKASNKTDTSMMNTANATDSSTDANRQRAQVKILEQPASKALRFRYECEGRSAGSIPGANSTSDNKTFPTIQVLGYRGKAVVVVSCVTKDSPYRPHPHSLVGKEGCKKGVCTLEINNENMVCTFSNLGIQCVKKKDIEGALKLREEIRVDPFHTGFGHRSDPQKIDLNAVRLCFQVFLEGTVPGKFTLALKPVVSEPIFDKKAMCDLTICKLSDWTSPVSGKKEIILLCDKVTKDDIEIVFQHEEEGHLLWEGLGEFSATDVHKQVAISFRTPAYKALNVEEPINMSIQLRRPSDQAYSEPKSFQYLPIYSGSVAVEKSFDGSTLFTGKRFKPDFQLYSHILAMDAAVLARQMFHAGSGTEQMDAFTQCGFPLAVNNVTANHKRVSESDLVEKSPRNPVTSLALSKSYSDEREVPPPLPEKGAGFANLKGNLVKTNEADPHTPKIQKGPPKSVNFDRSSLATVMSIVSETESDARFSIASSEDLNSRLSAAFSDYSDLTDVRSIVESEVDVNDALSLISSTHTLNDRLSLLSEASDISDSDLTVIDGNKSETNSIDTIEKQLEMLESMSVDPDCQTYSSFQMAMKHPIYGLPFRKPKFETPLEDAFNDQVYDDPTDDQLKFEIEVPVVPPRVESISVVSTPPLPPRRFKKINQPLPDPPVKDLGLRNALQAIKQTFKKSKPLNKEEQSQSNSSLSAISTSQENTKDIIVPSIQYQGDIPQPSDLGSDFACEPTTTNSSNQQVLDLADSLTEAENYALYMSLAPLATASEFDENETLSMLYADLNLAREALEAQGVK